jgi:hypothetical protein
MSSVSYQTIKLSRGKHASAADGACVMELASMLADEPFSDHPVSVCPVIGGLLRAYNDSVDDDRRQDLYSYAAKVVGSAGSPAVERARAERLAAWTLHMRERRWARSILPARLRVIGAERKLPPEMVGVHAIRSVPRRTDEPHAAVRSLIDELLTIGTTKKTSSRPAAPDASALRGGLAKSCRLRRSPPVRSRELH